MIPRFIRKLPERLGIVIGIAVGVTGLSIAQLVPILRSWTSGHPWVLVVTPWGTLLMISIAHVWIRARYHSEVNRREQVELERDECRQELSARHTAEHAERLDVDRALYARIRDTLPQNALNLVRHHDFGNTWAEEASDLWYAFEESLSGPNTFFLDSEIQLTWASFWTKAREFTGTLWRESFSDVPGRRTVDPGTGVDHETRQRLHHERRERLNAAAQAAWEAYCDLVRVARTRLLV
jgi:hypothetical protein